MPDSPIPNEFQRPDGWRFAFEGINLREVQDAIPPRKFTSAKNIRATQQQAVQTRPGYQLAFTASGVITDGSAYATLGTDDLPRILVRNTANGIYLDDGSLVTTMLGAAGLGVWMLPFRPNESPQTWMYVASQEDYQKLSAPDGSNVVTAYTVGIQEPASQCEAAAIGTEYVIFTNLAVNWTQGGVMGAPADSNRNVDTAGNVVSDPIIATRRYVTAFAGTLGPFQAGELITFAGGAQTLVEDVFAATPILSIQSIIYITGPPGLCLIQVEQTPTMGGVSQALGALRRGSTVYFPSTTELCYVLDVIIGNDGSLAIEITTVNTYLAGDTLQAVKTIQVDYSAAAFGQAILGPIVTASTTGAGVGTLSQTLLTSPFGTATSVGYPQIEDYLHASLKVDDPTKLIEIQLKFGKNGDYSTNYFYYSVQPSQFAAVVDNTETQLEAELASLTQSTLPPGTPLPTPTPAGSSYLELLTPLSSLIRVGDDTGFTLTDCNSVQIVVNCSAAVLFAFGSFWVGRGGQPDIGADGAEYKYRVVPRNSITGVRGNPSPVMFYGVRPRRQQVQVNLPDVSYDPQIDKVDIYRYGGFVTSYRFIGSTLATETSFIDNFTDESAEGGSLLQVDNFEPWPSVDVPFNLEISGGVTALVAGSLLVLSGFTDWPATIDRWLPGTLFNLQGHGTYTLRSRPTQLAANSYLFSFSECIETDAIGNILSINVLEPKVAKNPNPYVFGPDVNGSFFGVGDNLRPGTVSFSKSNVPDSVPDRYNLDLCPPSEPLIGGVIKGGVSLVVSTQRWWALYPDQTARRYNPIEQSVGRGLVAPYAICTDGVFVYFWMKDGIGMTAGAPYTSLTDMDLYPLFPHEGVPGVNITRFGYTYYAPDYGRAGGFRLRRIKTYLYADYQDTDGNHRTLVCDLRTRGWSQDTYADVMACHFGPEQQSGNLTSNNTTTYPSLYMGDTAGRVWKEVDCVGDNSNSIPCHIGTFEWDGGDARMQPLFGDSYLDCLPSNAVTVTPVSLGGNISPATTIAANNSRTFTPISVNGGTLTKYLGLLIEWTD